MSYENGAILDSNESIFFARELETVKAKTYDVQYPAQKFGSGLLIPISNEADPVDTTLTYTQYDQVGVAKMIASYADDLPRVDITGKQFSVPIKSIGDSYGYSELEIKQAMKKGKPLTTAKAETAKQAIMQLRNKIAFFGDPATGLPGFFTNPNIIQHTIPSDGTGASSKFVDKTPDQIIRDLGSICEAIFITTKGVEMPDTLLLPLSQYSYIKRTPRSIHSDVSILNWFLDNNEFITNVEWASELAGNGIGGTDSMMAYKRDVNKVSLDIAMPFEQKPAQQKNLEFVINCEERLAGVTFYYPLSAARTDGI